MDIQSKQEILERRKEIEQELKDMLKEKGNAFSIQDIRDVIFYEEDTDDMMKIVAMFDNGGGMAELSTILELASDAWNYFPHQILNGKAPVEMRHS